MGSPVEGTSITRQEEARELEMDEVQEHQDEDDSVDPDDEDTGDDGQSDESEGEEHEDSDEDQDENVEAPEDLGEFNPDDASEWDAQYTREDGTLDEAVLSAEFYANGEGLNEGTYDYLASKGITKEFAKQVEEALVSDIKNKRSSLDAALVQGAGGIDTVGAALEWGRGGGYDEAAQKRFNKIMDGTDEQAKADALDALVARHSKASPGTKASRRSKPRRDATRGKPSAKSTLKPFKNRSEYRQAKKDAGSDMIARRHIAERLNISKF
ncbi:MAG: hypothetical protein JJ891_06880 [Rhizobiaceae bacterium]|nr:hypothetical protein [Rhizobiaceae bacterium]